MSTLSQRRRALLEAENHAADCIVASRRAVGEMRAQARRAATPVRVLAGGAGLGYATGLLVPQIAGPMVLRSLLGAASSLTAGFAAGNSPTPGPSP